MTQSLLCIDLQSDLLTAVLFDGGKAQQVLSSTVVVVGTREPEEVVKELAAAIDCSDCRSYLAMGASFFVFRNITLPFSDRRSIEKILPFELQENSIHAIEDMVLDTFVKSGVGEEVDIIAAMLRRSLLSQWHAAFQEVGIFPERITLSGQPSIARIFANGQPPEEFIFLELRLDDAALFFVSSGTLQLIRPLSFKVLDSERESTASFVFDKETGALSLQGGESRGEGYEKLALSVKQTLTPLFPSLDFTQIPLYVEGSGALIPTARLWVEKAFGTPCLTCGHGGLLPLPLQLPESTANHAPFLTSCFSMGMQTEKSPQEFNFCKDGFAPRDHLAQYRLLGIAMFLGVAFIASLAWLIYENSMMKMERDVLVADIRTVFQETMPDVKRIVDPRQQLQVAINGAKISSGENEGISLPYTALHVLREISVRIPASLEVLLTRLVYDGKGLRLVGVTDNFNTVDAIKTSLEQSSEIRTVTISSTNQDPKDNSIRFELKVELEGTQ
jgi:type II secretory pathway component PulL